MRALFLRADPSVGGRRHVSRMWYTVDVLLTIELDREDDGRYIAEVPELPGVIVYGDTEEAAIENAKALALHVLADRIEHDEALPSGDAAGKLDELHFSRSAA